MTQPVILHYAPDNASLCVRLALEEVGRPYQTQLVDRAKSAQRSAAYLALNPNGLIPTLETNDGALFETAAILLWLADRTPGSLLPRPDVATRGLATTRLIWLSNTLHPTLRMLFYPEKYAPGAEDTLRRHTKERLVCLLDQLNTDVTHLVTDQPSAIACYLAPMLRWCALYGGDTTWFDLPQWPNLHRFTKDFEMRPAARNAALAEGLGDTPFSAPSLAQPPEGSAT